MEEIAAYFIVSFVTEREASQKQKLAIKIFLMILF